MRIRNSNFRQFVTLAVFLAAGPSIADVLRPGVIGTDDRLPLPAAERPWVAVGQINIRAYRTKGLCTGTLVAPDIVITAAHCVIDPWKGVPYPLKDIHFLAGVRGATREGHAVAKCLHFGADTNSDHRQDSSGPPRTGSSVSADDLITDAVALILDRDLAVAPAPLAVEFSGAPGLELIHAAYPADRRHQLTAHMNCRLLRTGYEGRLWFNDCDTHPASSGGPVFITKDGALKLAAIMVATGRQTENVALPISEWRTLVADNRCPSPSGS
jgi:protease YdgD